MTIDLTSIILGVLTLLSACGWFVSGRKHHHEIESLKADVRQKNMDLGKDYVDEFRKNIAEPLQLEVRELRTEVNQLRDAIQQINNCPLSADCPVRQCLRDQPHSDV